MRTLKTHYVRGLCDVTGETDLDDFIEVTFSISPELRRLAFHDPESLSVEDFHWKLRFNGDCRFAGQQVRFLDFLRGLVRGLTFLPPGSTTTLQADLAPGALSGVNVETQAAFMVPIAGEPATSPTLLQVGYDGQRFAPALSVVPPGPVVIQVSNDGSTRGSLPLINWPLEVIAQAIKPPLEFDPYLSGGTLVARQTFRRLFRSERVDEKEGLGIRQVTFVFTDLKGSTPCMNASAI
ncbi:DUF5939 domain-containing protein [Paraburkholderia sp. SIMBA_054]